MAFTAKTIYKQNHATHITHTTYTL